jgi:glycosyltransferase involved in cell wall biosynthesis
MSLLFYDDSPVFGGHEVMALLGLEAVLADYSEPVHFLASAANEKLCENVTALAAQHPHLILDTLPYQSSKFEALRNQLKPARIRPLAERFRQLAPQLVIAIQGNIEHSSLSLLAARHAGIPNTSYIPVPHSNAEMGARLGTFRDLFAQRLFRLADSFITITDEMARLLKLRGATAPIHIVYNGVDVSRFHPGSEDAALQLGLPTDRKLIGMIGRIEFRQKQQHLLVQALVSDPTLAATCHLVFAGDGPDAAALAALIQQHRLSATVLPWTDPAQLYRALHALVIPSRYEGLPLVMLEALATGTTVLASDRDGMKDLLPSVSRFQPNSAAALAATLNRFVTAGCPAPSATLVSRVRETMSLEHFKHSFSSTVLGLIPKAASEK